MKYAQMLDSMIANSNLSLRQLSRKCQELGCKITPSYICQLKNGKLPAPSDEITKSIANACGEKEYKKIVFEGNYEKLPPAIKEYITISNQLNKALFKNLFGEDAQQVPYDILNYINQLDSLSTLELSSKYGALSQQVEGQLSIDDLSNEIKVLTGTLPDSGKPEQISNFFLRDDSMTPTIPINAFVSIIPTRKELLKSKDIVAFYLDSRTIAIRRFFSQGEKIFLIPDNRDHGIYAFDSIDDFKYAGKIISYKVNM